MSYFKTTMGREYWTVSSARKKLQLINIVIWLLQLGTVIQSLLTIGRDSYTDWHKKPFWYHVIFTLVQQSLIQLWLVWIILGKVEKQEKFCLTVQGSHQHEQNRSIRKIYVGAILDDIRVENEKNQERILVFFRKLPSDSSSVNTGVTCQSFNLPLQGWFPFLQFIGFAALIAHVAQMIIYCNSSDFFALLAVLYFNCMIQVNILNSSDYEALLALLYFTLMVQVVIFLSSYSVAKDCGFMFPLIFIGYTRWFKNTSAYTELLEDQLQAKFGKQLKAEGEQLERAPRQYNSQTKRPDGVEVRNEGPVTKKCNDDQVRRLNLLLATEHDKIWKEATPETLETGGASLIVTREEMERLEEWAEERKAKKIYLQMGATDNRQERDTVPVTK